MMDTFRKLTQQLLTLICLFSALVACQPQEKQKEQAEEQTEAASTPPNIIVIYNDDLGYGDLSSYGAENIKTPNVDKLATQGKKLNQYYTASAVCSPSRAALLTGCYPLRVGIPYVLAPHGISWARDRWRTGLHPDEATLPEQLQQKGYATAIIGKWHLGHLKEHMPTNHGFEYFFGIPYSNDMYPKTGKEYPPLPIIENMHIIEENPNQALFTSRFTDSTLSFIERNPEKPFFVYLAHPMPHVPIFASDDFKGKSAEGLYGDVIEEIDNSVGRIMDYLDEKGLRDNTIIVFTSDNGPWLAYGNHAGSAGILREGKHTTMEGGQRVPCIVSWPGKIAPEESEEIVTNMDMLPTLLQWADAPMPSKEIDGMAMNAFFEGTSQPSGRELFSYYHGTHIEAMRFGKWKLHKPHTYNKVGDGIGMDGERGKYDQGSIDWALFDLEADPSEANDLASQQPQLLDSLRNELLANDSILQLNLREPYVYAGEAPETGSLW